MISILIASKRAFSKTGIAGYVMAVLAAFLLTSVSGTAFAADPNKGGKLYASHCAGCHGTDGVPVMPGAPNFKRAEGMLKPDVQLLNGIKAGKGAMPGFFGILKEQEILDVIAYMRTLN